jgi:hypothetical protein
MRSILIEFNDIPDDPKKRCTVDVTWSPLKDASPSEAIMSEFFKPILDLAIRKTLEITGPVGYSEGPNMEQAKTGAIIDRDIQVAGKGGE